MEQPLKPENFDADPMYATRKQNGVSGKELSGTFYKTRNQLTGETVGEYLQILNQLSKDCDFTDVKVEDYSKEYITDTFICGLKCPRIGQRLLESTLMTLDQAFEQARALELAEVHAAPYLENSASVPSAAMESHNFSEDDILPTSAASSSSLRSQKYFFSRNDVRSWNLPPRILFYFKGVCGATTPQKTGYAQDVKHPLGRLFRTQYVYCTTWLENRPWIWTRFMI
ncbi:putative retrovirus-related pol polyprotein from transposon opus [Nephila pilipes]|uniref:Putative retrovirus-related pol polyprotein from transposon opus n=1 Tax=Nephila pilipes TaxID=299642 RepID=A0A8X6P372_NEPPI|nr:putative retrovirus-related pol polyprotein from transposon opus [Nephila pilipes]